MADKIQDMIKTSTKVVPMIYAYTTPGIIYHNGYIKIGYTEQSVDFRIQQQTHTAGVKAKKEWQGSATYDDGTGDTFKDTDFHAYLRGLGVKQPQDEDNEYFDSNDRNEWFHIEPYDSKMKFNDFRANRGLDKTQDTIPYTLREEQNDAVEKTIGYKKGTEKGEFLWNAKPRFGKTLTTYDFIMRTKAEKVLIVTNRPAIANSWYDDYIKFFGRQSGYFFVSEVAGIVNRPAVMNYQGYVQDLRYRAMDPSNQKMKLIEFVSLQDLKGSSFFGGQFNKLREVRDNFWDLLVVDECHEGVDTYKTDVAFDRINRKFTLHLSGTPFKALANNKFADNAIFNWTYVDEQSKKANWPGPGENPYGTLPKLNLFTYRMSEIIKDEISQGVEINGETEEYAFDLNEFFATKEGRFIHESSVDKFLDALTSLEKYPFSTVKLRNELRHTFWLLNRVDSAFALEKKLKNHKVFKDYKVIVAAGDGNPDDMQKTKESYAQVVKAITTYEKTITLSVGQLTTGVTIPEWTAVLMLSNIKSPSLYMQAAFRAQNPCLFRSGTGFFRKENAYVFDFDPARTLTTFEQFANDLMQDTAAGHGDSETRKKHIRELLNFFPVISEDDNGEMIELDAEKVLSIPRKIKSQEVVKRGFMSDFLFQNITNVFHAPSEVLDILKKFTPVKEPSNKSVDYSGAKDIPLDKEGNVSIDDETVIGLTPDIFGDKLFGNLIEENDLSSVLKDSSSPDDFEKSIEGLKNKIQDQAIKPVIQLAKNHYGDNLKRSTENQISRQLSNDANRIINTAVDDFKIQQKTIEAEYKDALDNLRESGKTEKEVNNEFKQKQQEAQASLKKNLLEAVNNFVDEAQKTTVKTVETKIKEKEKSSIETSIKDHLRGFSRTIPSFLMAYGEDGITLITFDQRIPDNVFKEVTSISLEQFRFLRDGGDYIDNETGEKKHFEGNLFEPVVFDDSVNEFLRLKRSLANYFDEESVEDIFNYIPPQKTNQIFTPREVIIDMCNRLEEENPGCFNDSEKTFIDLYMKSGLYISEIVKRLFRSDELKRLFPNEKDRLNHIFGKQVFGLAPTEIIYRITRAYLLGFNENIKIEKDNIRLCDSYPLSKDGTLEAKLLELFGDVLKEAN